MRVIFRCVLLTACLASMSPVFAAGEAVAGTGSMTQLDEVEVVGPRIAKLRAEVLKAENRLVARYNELNTDDDLDIECLMFTPTGTHIPFRYCRSRLQVKLQERYAAELVDYIATPDIEGSPVRAAGFLAPASPVRTGLLDSLDDYQSSLARVLMADGEFRALVRRHGEARRRYDEALGKRWGSKSK